MPFRIVPERGQVPENGSESSTKECWHVFHEYDAWSNLPNETVEFKPEFGTGSGQARTVTCDADVGAGESTADEVGKSSGSVEGSNVSVDGDMRPMLFKDGLPVWINFDELDGLHSASLKGEGEASDSGKEVKDAHSQEPQQQGQQNQAKANQEFHPPSRADRAASLAISVASFIHFMY